MQKQEWMRRCEEAFDDGLVQKNTLEYLYGAAEEHSGRHPDIDAFRGRRLIEKLTAPVAPAKPKKKILRNVSFETMAEAK